MLINKRTENILAKNIVHLKSLHKIATGIMFKSKKSCKDKAFLFYLNPKKKYGITMLFVFFTIDILFLDEKFKVIKIKKNLRPFIFNYNPKIRFRYMIEILPAKRDIKVGDILEIN